jgi:hypothetical protein
MCSKHTTSVILTFGVGDSNPKEYDGTEIGFDFTGFGDATEDGSGISRFDVITDCDVIDIKGIIVD